MQSVAVEVLVDGPRNLVLHLTGIGDGGAQESNVVKADVSELTPPCGRLRVDKVAGQVTGGSVELKWDGDVPEPFMSLAGGQVEISAKSSGGLQNRVEGSNGDLLLSTVGFDQGSSYDLMVELVKKP